MPLLRVKRIESERALERQYLKSRFVLYFFPLEPEGWNVSLQQAMIQCIFLSEFHHITGPIISCQVPVGYVSKEIFDAIQNFIITKPELQNRLITVTSFRHKFVGCPIYIENDKYERNALIFNVVFTFDEKTNTTQYCPVVKKLANYLTKLESEFAFVSNPETDEEIPAFLQKVLDGLNTTRTCHISMGQSYAVHLKLSHTFREPVTIQNHHVPLLTVSKEVVMKHQWDLTTQQILHYVDGVSHVLKIAAEADVELNLVKVSLQNLLYYNYLEVVPIFQYSNVYTVTQDINKLIEDSNLQEECLKFVSKSERSRPDFRDVFMLLCSLTPGVSVKDICNRQINPHVLRIDERKLVQFGVMKGLLRRMHKYPVCLPGIPLSSRAQPFASFLDGQHNFDQICCETGLSYHELEEKVEGDDNVVVCWK